MKLLVAFFFKWGKSSCWWHDDEKVNTPSIYNYFMYEFSRSKNILNLYYHNRYKYILCYVRLVLWMLTFLFSYILYQICQSLNFTKTKT
jgi:hypothetical protein